MLSIFEGVRSCLVSEEVSKNFTASVGRGSGLIMDTNELRQVHCAWQKGQKHMHLFQSREHVKRT